MGHLCFDCKKNEAGKPKTITFKYKGLTFKKFKDGLTCKDCAIKEHKNLFEESGRNLVILENEHITVNWELFCKKDRTAREGTPSTREINAMGNILESVGIFSFSPKGNWEIIGSSELSLNPRFFLSVAFFTREEDVIKYAEVELANTQYDWAIRKICRVISKKKLLG